MEESLSIYKLTPAREVFESYKEESKRSVRSHSNVKSKDYYSELNEVLDYMDAVINQIARDYDSPKTSCTFVIQSYLLSSILKQFSSAGYVAYSRNDIDTTIAYFNNASSDRLDVVEISWNLDKQLKNNQ